MNIQQKILSVLSITIFFSQFIFSQSTEYEKLHLSGSLYIDSKIILNSYQQIETHPFADDMPGRKSPMLSGLFSAIIPGAGQIYNEDYWIAGIFIALEAALITTAVIYDKKGDDQTASFENYADQNWSVVDYAEWLVEYKYNNDQELLNRIVINNDPNRPPWEQVNWAELNAAEVGSHTLPPHGEQQYYELIGKYHQYSPGWNDYSGGSNIDLISSNFTYYAGERGKANDFYNTASTAVVGIYINHLLSAAEAVWGATRFNNNLALNLRVESQNLAGGIELVPTLKMKFSF
jgi:hypothetical protein